MIINKVWPSKNELVFSVSCKFSNGFCRHYQITFNMYLNAFVLEPSHYTYKGNERGYKNDMPEHIKLLGLDKEPNEIKVGPRSKAFGKEVSIDFFAENNGFFKEDIKTINNLDVGEMYTCMSIIDAVRVIRLKE